MGGPPPPGDPELLEGAEETLWPKVTCAEGRGRKRKLLIGRRRLAEGEKFGPITKRGGWGVRGGGGVRPLHTPPTPGDADLFSKTLGGSQKWTTAPWHANCLPIWDGGWMVDGCATAGPVQAPGEPTGGGWGGCIRAAPAPDASAPGPASACAQSLGKRCRHCDADTRGRSSAGGCSVARQQNGSCGTAWDRRVAGHRCVLGRGRKGLRGGGGPIFETPPPHWEGWLPRQKPQTRPQGMGGSGAPQCTSLKMIATTR